jgi:hypothetical protein
MKPFLLGLLCALVVGPVAAEEAGKAAMPMAQWVEFFESREEGTTKGETLKAIAESYAIGAERALVGSGLFVCPSPFSYLTLTSMMRDEYRRDPGPQTEAAIYTLFALDRLGCQRNLSGPKGK